MVACLPLAEGLRTAVLVALRDGCLVVCSIDEWEHLYKWLHGCGWSPARKTVVLKTWVPPELTASTSAPHFNFPGQLTIPDAGRDGLRMVKATRMPAPRVASACRLYRQQFKDSAIPSDERLG